jgi:threonine dehydratase
MPSPTPLEPAPPGLAPDREVYLKREDVHELGAFKWRGALPAVEQYKAAGAEGVVTASTGNHGAAMVWAAAQVGLLSTVYAPVTASQTKLSLIARLGADVLVTGEDVDEAKEQAVAYARGVGMAFFEDGSHAAQLVGYGAIGDEIVDQLGDPPAAVVVPVGGGALAAGIGQALARRSPETRRIGVVPKEAPVMARSWEARRPVPCDRCATIADGLAVRVAIPAAVEWLIDAADAMLEVSEREIADAVAAYDAAGIRAEGAAAAALAALAQVEDGGPIVLIVTGRNIDDELLDRCRSAPDTFPA